MNKEKEILKLFSINGVKKTEFFFKIFEQFSPILLLVDWIIPRRLRKTKH